MPTPTPNRSPRLRRYDGKVRVTRLEGEGRVRGYQLETRDGRVAAVVRPDTVKSRVSIGGKRE